MKWSISAVFVTAGGVLFCSFFVIACGDREPLTWVPYGQTPFGLPSCVFRIIRDSAFCGKRLGGTIRSVPVKTGTAYATNMPPAYSLYAAAPNPQRPL